MKVRRLCSLAVTCSTVYQRPSVPEPVQCLQDPEKIDTDMGEAYSWPEHEGRVQPDMLTKQSVPTLTMKCPRSRFPNSQPPGSCENADFDSAGRETSPSTLWGGKMIFPLLPGPWLRAQAPPDTPSPGKDTRRPWGRRPGRAPLRRGAHILEALPEDEWAQGFWRVSPSSPWCRALTDGDVPVSGHLPQRLTAAFRASPVFSVS